MTTKYVSWTLVEYSDPADFPSQYWYSDSDGYQGYIPKSGSARVTSGSAGRTEYKTDWAYAYVTRRYLWDGFSWRWQGDEWSSLDPYPYNDGTFSGSIAYLYSDEVPADPPTSAGTGHPNGYTTTRTTLNPVKCYYGGYLTVGDTRRWAQDYYGLVEQVKTRPPLFSWATPKVSGGNYDVKAMEWNGLMSRIQDWREYKIGDSPAYTIAYTGNTFYYYMFNEAVQMIARMNSNVPFTVPSGFTVYADDLNWLVQAINEL